MARVEGCWAGVLNDCDGPLTGEHIISVAAFSAGPGMPDNRRGRLPRRVTVRGPGILPEGPTTVRNLTAEILCEHHNNSTNDLDTESGNFRHAIDNWNQADRERSWNPLMNWSLRTFDVNGPLLERWFLKTAINNSFGHRLPIGEGAAPGWPTRELVEMVYGRRPITPPVGMFFLARVGQPFTFQESFGTIHMDRNGTHLNGALLLIRTMVFGVNFEGIPLQTAHFDGLASVRGSTVLQPVPAIEHGATKVQLRVRW